MKLHIFLLGILAFVASVHCEITVADGGKPIANKEKYLKAINYLRREYAKKSRIPNMYKLGWDDHLATQVETGDLACNWKTCRESRRDGDDNTEKFDQRQIKILWSDERRQELVGDYKKFFMSGHEDLTPGQQKIGCYHVSITDDGKDDKGNNRGYGVLKMETRCLLTPEGLGDSWNVPRGEAGSACAKGFVNDDGLCAPKSESSGSSSSAQKGKETGSNEESNTETSGQSSKMSGVVTSFVMMVVVKFL